MIDTHAHLDFPEYDDDRDEVIRRAFQNDLRAIINVGVDLERSRKSIEIAKMCDGVFASVGLHPDFFMKHEAWSIEQAMDELRNLAKLEKVVAIGETGLDYFRIVDQDSNSSKVRPFPSGEQVAEIPQGQTFQNLVEKQKWGFMAQIEIAKELNLPVIVHCRDSANSGVRGQKRAWEDLYEIIKCQCRNPSAKQKPKYKIQISNFKSPQKINCKIQKNNITRATIHKRPSPKLYQGSTFPLLSAGAESNSSRSNLSDAKFVLHCYSGSKKDTEKFLELSNVSFSFSGNITYPKPTERSARLAEAVRMIPLDRIMLDSDSPFLSPQQFRGKRNEPNHIRYIAKRISEIKNIGFFEVEKVTDENAVRLFGLPE